MTHLTTDDFSIFINGSDYATYIDTFSVKGGGPLYEFKPVWGGRKKKCLLRYNELEVTMKMIVTTDTQNFIYNLGSDNSTLYNFTVGSEGFISTAYGNFSFNGFDEEMIADEGFQMVTINFISEGLYNNRK